MSDIADGISPTAHALRYVILRHEGIPEPHYDLMFETLSGSPLATWRSSRWPIEMDTPLVRLSDHRREYLDFEGALSGDRGHVRRVTKGYFRLERLDEGHWRLNFRDLIASSQIEFRHDSQDQWTGRPMRF